MKIYVVYIRDKYIERVDSGYARTYIPSDNLYAWTTSKNIIKKFKDERNPDAFLIHKTEDYSEDALAYFKIHEGCNRELVEYTFEHKEIDDSYTIIMTAYEKSAIHDYYVDNVTGYLPYLLEEYDYHIFKEDIIKSLDAVLFTYFRDMGDNDEDVRFDCQQNFEAGVLPCGTLIADYRPNVFGIINVLFGSLFMKG